MSMKGQRGAIFSLNQTFPFERLADIPFLLDNDPVSLPDIYHRFNIGLVIFRSCFPGHVKGIYSFIGLQPRLGNHTC